MGQKRRVVTVRAVLKRCAAVLLIALPLVEQAGRIVQLATKLLSSLGRLRGEVERLAAFLPDTTRSTNIAFATAIHVGLGVVCGYFALKFARESKGLRHWLFMIGAAILYYLALLLSDLAGFPLVGHNQAIEVINLILTLCIWNLADTLSPPRNTKRARLIGYGVAAIACCLAVALICGGEPARPYLAAFGVTPLLVVAALRLWRACGKAAKAAPDRNLIFWQTGVLLWALAIALVRPRMIFDPAVAASALGLIYYGCMGGKFCVGAFIGLAQTSTVTKKKKRGRKNTRLPRNFQSIVRA